MRVSQNASRAASAIVAAVLTSSVCLASIALAQSEPGSTVRSAAVEAPKISPEAVVANPDDLEQLPPTSDAPPESDFKEPVKAEEPATAAPAAPTQALEAQGKAILARLKDGKPLLSRLTSKEREAMLTYYTIADFKPAWIANGAYTPAAQSVISRLEAAAEDGLDPNAYPVPQLSGAGLPMSETEIADADLKLSAAAALYARDARGGRINLASISKDITPDLDLTPADIVLGELSVSGPEAGDRLQAYNPNQEGYLALKQRLATLRGGVSPKPTKSLRVPVGPVLKVGMSDPRVRLLRDYFDLPAHSEGTLDAAPGEPDVYDRAVSDAIAAFQRSHDLPDNGNLTRSTIVALALAGSTQASSPARSGDEAELISNMERWRWLPRELGPDYVMVNIPEFRLRVYRGGVLKDETRVIVGKPESPTPIFSGAMETAVVNPSWYVPPSILKKMLASGRTGGFEVVRRGGHVSLRQPPGERNALGFIKFLFPNQHAVYLHDTPNRSLFSASKRAFSHGCVRVDDPFRFADAVLPDTWTEASLKKLIGKGERSIRLPHKLPVHLAYFTAFVDDNGVYRKVPDLYGYDGKIKQALGLSTRPGVMASVAKEPARQVSSTHVATKSKHRTASTKPQRQQKPRREASRNPPPRYVAQRPRRQARQVYGEPGFWTQAPAPSTPRFWW